MLRAWGHPRAFGRSKFGAYRFFAGFMDLLTVMFLTKYSKKPLHLFGGAGLVLFSLGLLINLYLAVLKLMGQGIGHRPLLFLGVLLMLIGFQFISTGLLGEMLAIALKHRPHAACIVPERRAERTTEGGLDAAGQFAALQPTAARLMGAGMVVSLFIEPSVQQLEAAV